MCGNFEKIQMMEVGCLVAFLSTPYSFVYICSKLDAYTNLQLFYFFFESLYISFYQRGEQFSYIFLEVIRALL